MSVQMSLPPKSPQPPPSEVMSNPDSVELEQDPHEEMMKMRLGTSPHHTNPRSRTLVGWKNTMPLEDYRFVREQKRNQKNIPTTSSDYNEQHLIIAHRLAELEKRRVGTRYLAKDQTAPADGGAKNSIKDSMAKCTIS